MNYDIKIYLDMDGVLADFQKGFKLINPEHFDTEQYITKYGKNSFWRLIDNYGRRHFFASLDWTEGGKELWRYVKYNFKNVSILTSLGKSDRDGDYTREGKRDWLHKNIPELRDYQIIMVDGKGGKKEYADSNSIIIDDTLSIINDWRERNGIAIHHKNTANTINKLKKILNIAVSY